MPYELAKELKAAGFPQPEGGKFDGDYIFDDGPNSDVADGSDLMYAPTLEELIDACGDIFLNLKKYNVSNQWGALAFSNEEAVGPTPTEAVAKLWLTLNKEKALAETK